MRAGVGGGGGDFFETTRVTFEDRPYPIPTTWRAWLSETYSEQAATSLPSKTDILCEKLLTAREKREFEATSSLCSLVEDPRRWYPTIDTTTVTTTERRRFIRQLVVDPLHACEGAQHGTRRTEFSIAREEMQCV